MVRVFSARARVRRWPIVLDRSGFPEKIENATKLGRLCVTEVKMKYGMLRRSRRHGGYLPWLFPFGGTGVRFVAPICRGSGWNVDRGSDEYPLSCLKDLGATAWAGVEHVLDS
ncbi:hypothetical protein AB1N83_002807 [Pleurotus pulmonarius]